MRKEKRSGDKIRAFLLLRRSNTGDLLFFPIHVLVKSKRSTFSPYLPPFLMDAGGMNKLRKKPAHLNASWHH